MSTDDQLGSLSGPLADLVDIERREIDAPLPQRDRVWAQLAAKLPGPGGQGGPGGNGGPRGHGGPGDDGGGTGGGHHGGGKLQGSGAASPKVAIAKLAAVAAIGVVTSIVLVVTSRSQREEARTPAAPALATAPARVDAGARGSSAIREPIDAAPEPQRGPRPALSPSPAAAEGAPATPHRAAPAAPAAGDAKTEAEATAIRATDTEDMLIARARVSLARARFDEALALLARHEERFPRGDHRSERELLIVRALIGTSDRAAAVERAERLRRSNPADPSLPAIDALLRK